MWFRCQGKNTEPTLLQTLLTLAQVVLEKQHGTQFLGQETSFHQWHYWEARANDESQQQAAELRIKHGRAAGAIADGTHAEDLGERNMPIYGMQSGTFDARVQLQVFESESESTKTRDRNRPDAIPSAVRGVLQIEITFGVDAKRVWNRSAQDRCTGGCDQTTMIGKKERLSQAESDGAAQEAEGGPAELQTQELEAKNGMKKNFFPCKNVREGFCPKGKFESGDKTTIEKAIQDALDERERHTIDGGDPASV